jgi:hypothetical protein
MKYIKKFESSDEFDYMPIVGDYIYLKLISPFEETYPEIHKVVGMHKYGFYVRELDEDERKPRGETYNNRYRYKKVPDEDLEEYYMKIDAKKYNL